MKNVFCYLILSALCGGCAVDGGPPVYDITTTVCTNHNVTRHSLDAGVLRNPEIHFVFFGSYWTSDNMNAKGQISSLTAEWSSIMAGGLVFQRLAEYGVGAGTLDSNIYFLTPDLNKDLGDASTGVLDDS